MPGVPAVYANTITCPRCLTVRTFWNVDGGTVFRCSGCDYFVTLGTQAPTGTATAILAAGGTAITVASGGASFTNGMKLLYDTGANAEILTVNGTAGATSIPVFAAIKAHANSVTFGQLSTALTNGAVINAGYNTAEQVQSASPATPTAAAVAANPSAYH